MDTSYWLLTATALGSLSAGAVSAAAALYWRDARLISSARRRAVKADRRFDGPRSSGSLLRDLANGAEEAWGRSSVSRTVSARMAARTAGAAVVGLVMGLLTSSIAIGGSAALAVGIAIARSQRAQGDRERELLRAQVPQLLSTLASSVGAGLSLAQAFDRAAQTAEEPMAGHLHVLSGEIALGVPAADALRQWADRTEIPELQSVAVGLGVQHTAGGGVVRVLEQASFQMRQGDALRRLIRSHTAQGRMTLRMVTILPIGLAVLMAFLSDDYVSAFTGTPSGRSLLGAAVGLEAVGIYSVSRLLRVEVER